MRYFSYVSKIILFHVHTFENWPPSQILTYYILGSSTLRRNAFTYFRMGYLIFFVRAVEWSWVEVLGSRSWSKPSSSFDPYQLSLYLENLNKNRSLIPSCQRCCPCYQRLSSARSSYFLMYWLLSGLDNTIKLTVSISMLIQNNWI